MADRCNTGTVPNFSLGTLPRSGNRTRAVLARQKKNRGMFRGRDPGALSGDDDSPRRRGQAELLLSQGPGKKKRGVPLTPSLPPTRWKFARPRSMVLSSTRGERREARAPPRTLRSTKKNPQKKFTSKKNFKKALSSLSSLSFL